MENRKIGYPNLRVDRNWLIFSSVFQSCGKPCIFLRRILMVNKVKSYLRKIALIILISIECRSAHLTLFGACATDYNPMNLGAHNIKQVINMAQEYKGSPDCTLGHSRFHHVYLHGHLHSSIFQKKKII